MNTSPYDAGSMRVGLAIKGSRGRGNPHGAGEDRAGGGMDQELRKVMFDVVKDMSEELNDRIRALEVYDHANYPTYKEALCRVVEDEARARMATADGYWGDWDK